MFTFIAFVAIAVVGFQLADTRQRLRRAEDILNEAAKRIGALQRHAGLLPPKPGEAIDPAAWQRTEVAPAPVQTPVQPIVPAPEPEPRVELEVPCEVLPEVKVAFEPQPEPEAETQTGSEPISAPVFASVPSAAPAAMPPVVAPAPAARPEPVFATAAPEPAPSLATRFEVLFGKQLPIWAGGITLAIAGMLIVKYAIDIGFFARIFTHGVQVIAGLLFGSGLIAGADFAWRNEDKVRDPRVPQALSGAGLATLYASVLVAATAYHLVGPPPGSSACLRLPRSPWRWRCVSAHQARCLAWSAGWLLRRCSARASPHVPLLTIDLALTIGGLVGVSRMRRWPWLAIAALIGGASWSLWLVLSARALDAVSALSTGGLVLVLALALPVVAFDAPRRAVLRGASACVGALQLAILVAIGGFEPLHWGLFALIAAAGQVLAWRDRSFAIVPTISLALSALLLVLWPAPTPDLFATVGLALAAIHALPLLARMWRAGGLQPAVELSALALAAPALVKLHFPAFADTGLAEVSLGSALLLATALGLGWRRMGRLEDVRFAGLTAVMGLLLALVALLVVPHWAAPLALAALGLGLLQFGQWARDPRIESVSATMTAASLPALMLTLPIVEELPRLLLGTTAIAPDHSLERWGGLAVAAALFAARAMGRELRFIALGCAGALAYGTLAQTVPGWSLPLAMAVVSLALFALGQWRQAASIERLAGTFAGTGVILLPVTRSGIANEWSRLVGTGQATAPYAAIRWGGLALLTLVIAVRSRQAEQQRGAQVMTVLLGYGFAAQVLPQPLLALVPALAGAALLMALPRISGERLLSAVATSAALGGAWAAWPLVIWASKALDSLAGIPMAIDTPLLDPGSVLRRLLIPALLFGGALWLQRDRIEARISRGGLIVGGLVAGIAVHVLYRLGFAALFGQDFVAAGLGQRLVWEALLLGAGWVLLRQGWLNSARAVLLGGTIHALVYTIGLHDALWTAQDVGGWPLINLLAPAFAIVPVGLVLLGQSWPNRPAAFDRLCQIVQMVAVSLFGWATLRQAFHGGVLTDPGVFPAENILRSLLLLALAIGYLLWGIRRARHDWRIASLVLMLGAVGKVFLFDASGLEGLLRIGSFVALGFSLIGIGWLYSRQLATGPAEPAEPAGDEQVPAN